MKRYIDMDVLIEHGKSTIESCNVDSDYNSGFCDGIDFIVSFAETLPIFDSERAKGCMIFMNIGGREKIVCGQCGASLRSVKDRFCHSCGCFLKR